MLLILLLLTTSVMAGKLTLQPVPSNQDTIENQLKRFKGQTKFLNSHGGGRAYAMGGAPGGRPEARSASKGADGQREQQESDIYKIGKEGSKLLYLLNDYRGLQTVSFANDPNQPSLVSRVAPTGNHPDDMYYDEKNQRIVVLERLYFDADGNYTWSNSQSRALVYDVSTPHSPKIIQDLPIDGEIADSRLVGNILYVASSIRPDYRNDYNDKSAKGMVTSINFSGEKLSIVEKVALALPTSSRENMNIVEINEGDAFKYYLVAVLSQSAWGWWDRQSLVEVVDISDAAGHIQPLMVVSAKGSINERSQTSIKNGTLMVVSNYQTDNGTALINRIAVESFKLPTETSEIISENEALFRKLGIERQLKGKTNEETDSLYTKLISDSELGIKDRFVQTTTGQLRKILADSVVTVGDSTGLHAVLQDVRFVDNLLYVFWVPQNQIDPFDLFDISQPQNGIRYLKRLQFEGWIERAIPVQYQNHQYVLGLGHIVPTVNNENGRRQPQAMLFEITNAGTDNARAIDIAQITLGDGRMWTNFNSSDKFIEMKLNSDGLGSLMFQVQAIENGKYVSGGKLIDFNLNAAISGNTYKVFKEGRLLNADANWLKRVFSNPEIDRINTFSNQSLGIFNLSDRAASTAIAQSVGVLELARNITSYVTLPQGGQYSLGVQIIQGTGSYYDNTSELRLVDTKRVDAEKSEALAQITLKGNYVTHLVDQRDGSLVIASQYYAKQESAPNAQGKTYTQYVDGVMIDRFVITPVGFSNVSHIDLGLRGAYRKRSWYSQSNDHLVQLSNSDLFFIRDDQLVKIENNQQKVIPLNGCTTVGREQALLEIMNGKFYYSSSETVADPVRKNLSHSRNYIAQVNVGLDSATCSSEINIPGKLIALSPDGALITEDSRVTEISERTNSYTNGKNETVTYSYYEVKTENAIESLKLVGQTATLVDDFITDDSVESISENLLGFITTKENSYGGNYRRGYGGFPSGNGSLSQFVSLSVDKDSHFTREVFEMPEDFLSHASISSVFADPTESGAFFGLLTSGRQLQIVRWSPCSAKPVVQKIARSDIDFGNAEVSSTAVLPSWYYYGGHSKLSYNPILRTLELAQGMSGVVQLRISQ
ncbi:MAG: beta-propeller domain-containing protein [Xanthomonadaceae bacterium]|nr:beta-propeller domain-containing protein [Xanthomonadaceae bacterium]